MADESITIGDHRDLLDIIDGLRSQGVSHYVALPEIIVCGDQSAGKSSVLEAISGMPFPTKDSVCTRFATELVLRRGLVIDTKVSIIPSGSRYGEDKERLEDWQPKASLDMEGLGTVTDEAKRAMAEPNDPEKFYDDILRIELTGPEQSHLTMVDLPGLFRRGNKEQSEADVSTVRNMVVKYMARQRSIILTVVSAKYDYVLQEVTLLAKEADPKGLRTIGLITKPDTLDVGSDSESYFVRLAQNSEEELRLGWHVLKNRKFEEREFTSAQRDDIEREFFSQGLWDTIDPSCCGVAALRIRLSTILRDQILDQFPSLKYDVEKGIEECTARLERFGPVRETSQQQLRYLLQVSEKYTSLMTQAVEGTYTDEFFGSRRMIDTFSRRLRAVVRNQLDEFEEHMRLDGHSQHIVDSESEGENGGEVRDLPRISRSEYVEEVAKRLKYNKGRELSGLFNPLIVSDLFAEQCEPWGEIAKSLVDNILEAAHLTTQLIIESITASDVTEGILQLVDQEIEGLKVGLDAQVKALLLSAARHPITNNPELTKNVRRTQRNRHTRDMKKLIRKTFGSHRFDDPDSKISVNPIQLVDLMGEGFDIDMERSGSSIAVDYMEAYYEVAVSRFIDDMSSLAIEDCLISKLSTIFRSKHIVEMNDEDISRLAGETQDSAMERQRLEAKRGILETGLRSLKSLYKRRNVVETPEQNQLASEDSQQVLVITPGRSQRASIATDSIEGAPEAINPSEPFRSLAGTETLQPADIWPSQAGNHGYM